MALGAIVCGLDDPLFAFVLASILGLEGASQIVFTSVFLMYVWGMKRANAFEIIRSWPTSSSSMNEAKFPFADDLSIASGLIWGALIGIILVLI